MTSTELEEERMCCYERYRILVQNDMTNSKHIIRMCQLSSYQDFNGIFSLISQMTLRHCQLEINTITGTEEFFFVHLSYNSRTNCFL